MPGIGLWWEKHKLKPREEGKHFKHTGVQRALRRRASPCRELPQAPLLGGVSSTFQDPSQALPGWLTESTLPAAKAASRQLPTVPSSSCCAQAHPPGPLTEEGGPHGGGGRAGLNPGQVLPNRTQSPARNQASGLLLPTQTSISTEIFQEGRAALSKMDSFRLESLPCYIFNVLTYSFHGPGFTEAPPYRLPDEWLPTAPITLPNGKVKSCGKDTRRAAQQMGGQSQQFPCSPGRPPPPPERHGWGHGHLGDQQPPWASRGISADGGVPPDSAWKALSGTPVRW